MSALAHITALHWCVRHVSFRCDDVIILQLDWTFLVLGHRAKYSDLVHQTIFRVHIWAGHKTKHYKDYQHY